VHELAGDHDACLVSASDFARVTGAAVADVLGRLSART
jgi:hypothetical protein